MPSHLCRLRFLVSACTYIARVSVPCMRLDYYEFSIGFVRKGAAGVAGVSSICASCDPSIELVPSVFRCCPGCASGWFASFYFGRDLLKVTVGGLSSFLGLHLLISIWWPELSVYFVGISENWFT